ncbi:MAG: hypothetical protein IJ930_07195 [Lachnospiraceae bacterium]|nr:hypothetical protein [Lachnospiraceae bacterium]
MGTAPVSGPLSPDPRRVTLLAGHYGSGKTNIAVNYAEYLSRRGLPVSIGDLDVVNPYFRTKDSEDELRAAGIEVISLPFANSSVDLPSLPAEAYRLVQDQSRYAVLDIGGDDRGAYALGRYRQYILEEQNFEMLFVANFMRPLTREPEEAMEVLMEIEEACRIPFTGIVNNTNLAEETLVGTVQSGYEKSKVLADLAGLPLVMTTVYEKISEEAAKSIPDVFTLKLQKKY